MFQDPTLAPFITESRRRENNTTGDTMCGKTLATDDTITAWQSFYRGSKEGNEIITLMKLGSGVNGHMDTCHGGFLGVVLDEVIGTVAENERPKNMSTMTAYLNVDYKAPVRTPSIILVRAWLEKREGRKLWAKGTIEDGNGNVFTKGNALFIIIDPKILAAKI